MNTHQVVIAGGGPTGLMLAGELALGGIDVAIVEKRNDQEIAGHRAGGLHARTLEIFDQRGIVERFLAEGQKAQVTGFAGVKFDISHFPTRHPYGLALWQVHVERILADWVSELGVPVYRGVELSGFAQDATQVEIALGDGRQLRADYLIGCDGGRSFVRKKAGIDFPGAEATVSNLIAEVEMDTVPPFGVHRTAYGVHSFGRAQYEIRDGKIVYAESGPIGVMVTEPQIGKGEATIDDLRAALIAVCGTDYGMHSPVFVSRFTDAARRAAHYRQGRVLIAGDAAHIHPPDGGQGLQTGVQDAVNLGWKLALVVKGMAPDSLLDSYEAERHPVAARVLRHTLAAVALRRDDERSRALRDTMADLLETPAAREQMAAELSQLSIRYDFGSGHPLLGRRMPDLELQTAAGSRRTYSYLHEAKPVLLRFGGSPLDISGWSDRVQLVEATTADDWVLPVIGPIAPPAAVLIRPDGHVAWVGDGTDSGLSDALSRWFGPPRQAA